MCSATIKLTAAGATLLLLAACSGDSSSGSGLTVSGGAAGDPVGAEDNVEVMPPAQAACAPGQPPLEMTGQVASSDAKTYQLQPFDVDPVTERIEVAYTWSELGQLPATPLTETTIDLGLWDADGFLDPAGFRGWSGSRQGRIDREQAPVFIESDSAERGYVPGLIEPGTWFVELGIAAVSPEGAEWRVMVQCLAADTEAKPPPDPVDPTHVANPEPGWYHGDFHMHAFHSNPNAPDFAGTVEQAREAQLDFLMITEYVTGRHWNTLGATQRANPDLVIWPGREIITYFGHVNTLGETPGVLEYRHGFMDVNIREIQDASLAAGALFQVNHPTSFPGPVFENFCRGCEFELGDEIDWNRVDTIEAVNGPMLANSTDIGLPAIPGQIQNPFVTTAIRLWEERLLAGNKITAVSGSDSKGVDAPAERGRKGYGSSATAVLADNLSRPALTEGIQAGHVYIRTLGVAGSPELEMTVTAGQQTGTFGDSLTAETATLEVRVTGGQGQLLKLYQNGLPVPLAVVPILGDPFTHSQPIFRLPLTEGSLGTFWRIETFDPLQQVITTIGNPVFLTGP